MIEPNLLSDAAEQDFIREGNVVLHPEFPDGIFDMVLGRQHDHHAGAPP